MASDYENVLYDRILTGVETILEEEFKSSLQVYQKDTPKKFSKQSLRIWFGEDPMEFITKLAGNAGQTYRYSIECTVSLGASQRARATTDARLEVVSRAIRVLNNNCAYSPSGTYQWHHGTSDGLLELVLLEDEAEEGWRFTYSTEVTELF